jgi:FkbM family methyltransferase
MKRYLINLLSKKVEKNNSSSAKQSFSQCGEDLIVEYIFNLRAISTPSYLDIGANDPFFISNTALFYEKGCRGINVEANPLLYPKFREHRPEDINLNIGISDKEEELDFYVMADDTLSSFSKSECDALIKSGKKLESVQRVKLTTVSDILAKYFEDRFPDFLSIDVEGFDLQVLRSINFEKHWPKVICVEAAEYSPIGAGARRSELIDLLAIKGYYEYANTNLNAIMVKNEFWFI